MPVVIAINNSIYELPEKYKDYSDLFNCEEFKTFLNERRQKEYEKDKFDILQNALKKGNMMMGVSGKGNSMIDYIPQFISYLNKKKRKEKIENLLNI